MLGTYLAFALVLGSALATGTLVFRACGRPSWSWLAPAVGIAALLPLGWGAANLIDPVAALIVLLAPLAWGAVELARSRPHLGAEHTTGVWVGAFAALLASIPFIAERRFGILGTSLNPDMSQHLFAADRLVGGGAERLIDEGYPLGPHALVAGLNELGIDLVHGFGGLAIAVAVITCLTPLALLRDLPPARRATAALLTGFVYLAASYFTQGAFKESIQALMVLAFAVGLHEMGAGRLGGPERAKRWRYWGATPLAALAVGSIYAYSFPGVAWLAGTLVVWAAWESLVSRRSKTRAFAELMIGKRALRRRIALALVPPTAVALGVFLVAIAPELGRITTFASFETFNPPGAGRGNLFDSLSPFEALGIWPSGDFRVEPGGGFAPAIAFWIGGAVALAAAAYGVKRSVDRDERALPAALAACVVLYLYPVVAGTIYQESKALAIAAPVVALLATRALLLDAPPLREWRGLRTARALALPALAAAFVAGAAGSSLLTLANGPVGPASWSPELIELRERGELGQNGEGGDSTLVVGAPGVMEDEHGADLFLWELRGGHVCAAVAEGGELEIPDGVAYVVVREGTSVAASPQLEQRGRGELFAVYEVTGATRLPEPPCPMIADGQRADPAG